MQYIACCDAYCNGLCLGRRYYRTAKGKKNQYKLMRLAGETKRQARRSVKRCSKRCLACLYGGRIMRDEIKMGPVLVIDGNYMMHRHYHSTSLTVRTKKGEIPIGGVYGFVKDVLALAKKFVPSLMIVAWDGKGKTWRHKLTKQAIQDGIVKEMYKANRKKDKEFLRNFGRQTKITRSILNAIGVPQYYRNGVEADDAIGSIVERYKEQHRCIIVSADSDFYQLLERNVVMYKSVPEEIYTEAHYSKEFGLIAPKSWIYVKALAGDAKDNVDGIEGIGPVTACKLISTYGYADLLRKNVDPKWSPEILSKVKMIKLAENLKTIRRDMKLPNMMSQAKVDKHELRKWFRKLQFKSLNVLEYIKHFGRRR